MHGLQDIYWITQRDGKSVLSLGPVDPIGMMPTERSLYVPVVPFTTAGVTKMVDVMSLMAQEGIIYVYGPITSELAQIVIAQLEYHALQKEKEITLYIDSPGGSVTAGMAICDTIEKLNSGGTPVGCVVQGIAASMAFVITVVCKQGMRKARASSRLMMHEPSISGLSGKFTELKAEVDRLGEMFDELVQVIVKGCGQAYEKVKRDMLIDYWMTVPQSVAYGILDGAV